MDTPQRFTITATVVDADFQYPTPKGGVPRATELADNLRLLLRDQQGFQVESLTVEAAGEPAPIATPESRSTREE